MYGYNFVPGALECLEESDDTLTLPLGVDNITDREELNENNLLYVDIPNDIAGCFQIMKSFPHENHWDSSDDEGEAKTAGKTEECKWGKVEPMYQL
ncbi:hypothetical protein Trydic_g17820 [Trypoxylus dichotomus]